MGRGSKKSRGSKSTGIKAATSNNKSTSSPSNTATGHSKQHDSTLLPLSFPSDLPRPVGDFLKNEPPYEGSFQAALKTSYEGFTVDKDIDNVSETTVQTALYKMSDCFRYDITQPFGLGTKCAKTYVTRCLLGDVGTTYKYLGLRMFAIPWEGETSNASCQEIFKLKSNLTKRTRHHLDALTQTRAARGAPPTRGQDAYDICLINRMEFSKDLKPEPTTSGKYKTSVSWHADSSLEHHSSIAVYQTIVESEQSDETSNSKRSNGRSNKKGKKGSTSMVDSWSVALRVSPNAEGPQASRRGTDIDSAIDTTAPPISASLPSGSTYYLLDDFNHHHQHTVLCNNNGGDDDDDSAHINSSGVRYSCTFRLLRESHNVHFLIERCKTTCSHFHKKGAKLWRSEQLLLTEMESEWLRQFYIQGQQHHDLMMEHRWKGPIHQLLQYWSQLESRTKRVIDLLRAAAEGKCKSPEKSSEQATANSRAQRKLAERRKKAVAAIKELIERGNRPGDNDFNGQSSSPLQMFYEPLAVLLEERAQMRELWQKREKDHTFRQLDQSCRPVPVPFLFGAENGAKALPGQGVSPLLGAPQDLKGLASELRLLGRAFESGNASDLPNYVDPKPEVDSTPTIVAPSPHMKDASWAGWKESTFGLEMQSPWALALLSGEKSIETRAYNLPQTLLGQRIAIIESPLGDAGVSKLGDNIDLAASSNRISGWCIFSSVKEYTDQQEFEADEKLHLVKRDSAYAWDPENTKRIYGWKVQTYEKYDPSSAPAKTYSKAIRRMRSLFQLENGIDTDGKSQSRKRRRPKKNRGSKQHAQQKSQQTKKRRY